MEATVYKQDGNTAGKVKLSDSVFGVKWNGDLVHQVVVSMQANARTSVAHTKDRSEVSGGGKKPWKQKGTARARHGSTRSPIWRHGGATHGPRNDKDYSKKVNKKMKVKALYTVLSQKIRDNEVLFVDKIALEEMKTSKAKDIVESLAKASGAESLATKKKNTLFLALWEGNENVAKSFDNFGNITVSTVKELNPTNLLKYKYLVITQPEDSVKFIEGKSA